MSAMATIKINVKWGKENVPCEIKPGQTPDQLFDDLQSKTGVPVARQKLMARGAWRGVLKSGMAMDLKDGQNVTLMGTADVLLKPKVETKFLEDMKVRSRRLLWGLDAIGARRLHETRSWVFFFPILSRFGPRRGAAPVERTRGRRRRRRRVSRESPWSRRWRRRDATPPRCRRCVSRES